MKQRNLEHVKWVKSKGKLYPYFNSGQKKASGATIYLRLPDPASAEFYAEYARMKTAREKRAIVACTVAQQGRATGGDALEPAQPSLRHHRI